MQTKANKLVHRVATKIPLCNRAPQANAKQLGCSLTGKAEIERVVCSQLYTSDTPTVWSPSIPSVRSSHCQVLGHLVPLQGILKGRSSGQVVPAAARALPKNSPTGADHKQQGSWPASPKLIESKVVLLAARQASKLRGELLGQGRAAFYSEKKMADQCLHEPSSPSQISGSFYTEEGCCVVGCCRLGDCAGKGGEWANGSWTAARGDWPTGPLPH